MFSSDRGGYLRLGFGLVGRDIFELVRRFVAVVVEMEVDDLELEVGAVFRLVRVCLNDRLYFFWCLSRMCLEEEMSNNCGHPFGMVMWADFLIELFLLDGGCLGNVTGAKMEVVVVDMVAGVAERVI